MGAWQSLELVNGRILFRMVIDGWVGVLVDG